MSLNKSVTNCSSTPQNEVSVILPIYDGDDDAKLEKCLSALTAELEDVKEVVVVLDGPVTNIKLKLVNDFIPSEKLKVLQLPENRGLTVALNCALNQVKTKYAIRIDSDDMICPGRVVDQYNYVERHSLDICSAYIKQQGGYFDEPTIRQVPLQHEEIIHFLRYRSAFNHMAIIYRVDKIRNIGGYPEIFNNEDYALWLNAFASGLKFGNINKVMVRADVPVDFAKRRAGWKRAKSEWKLFLYRRKLGVFPLWVDIASLVLRVGFRLMPKTLMKMNYARLHSKT